MHMMHRQQIYSGSFLSFKHVKRTLSLGSTEEKFLGSEYKQVVNVFDAPPAALSLTKGHFFNLHRIGWQKGCPY